MKNSKSILGVIVVLLSLATFRTDHMIDNECGIQEYERSILGITIELLSERNYKEFENGAECDASSVKLSLISRCYLFGYTIQNESN